VSARHSLHSDGFSLSFGYATLMGYGFASSVEINQGRLETMLNGAVFHSFHVYDQVPRRELGIHSSGCVLFSSLRSSSKRLIALPRHLQQASIETEISRQSGQVRWPHGKHFTLKRGNSGRLLIYAYGGCNIDTNYRCRLSRTRLLSWGTAFRLYYSPVVSSSKRMAQLPIWIRRTKRRAER